MPFSCPTSWTYGELAHLFKVRLLHVFDYPHQGSLFAGLSHLTDKNLAIGGCIGNLSHDSSDPTFQDLEGMLQAWEDSSEDNPGKYSRTVGMLFAGSGVTAASVLLSTPINTRGKVEAELRKLKEAGFREQKSCAFMFACCGRGRNFYKGKANVESEVFRQLFPKTPLLGIFGNGEIGLTFLPQQQVKDTFANPSASKKAKKDVLQTSEFSHSFTTVFVMLSFE